MTAKGKKRFFLKSIFFKKKAKSVIFLLDILFVLLFNTYKCVQETQLL